MGVIWTPKQRGQQSLTSVPKINRANSIGSKIGWLSTPSIDNGRFLGREIVTTGFEKTFVDEMPAANFISAGAIKIPPNTFPNSAGTLFAVARLDRTSAYGYLIGSEYDGTNEPLVLRVESGAVALSSYFNLGGGGFIQHANSVPVGSYVLLFGRVNGTNSSVGLVFANALSETSGGIGTGSNWASSNWYVGTGANSGSPWRRYEQPIVMVGWANNLLSNAELLSLWENPGQVYESPRSPVFISLPSGSNNTATLSSILSNVTLAGIGSVSRTATLSTTLDNITLAGVGNAAVNNVTATLATTLANVTLTGVGGVTRTATLATTLEAATLAGVGSVAVGANRDGVLATTLAAVTLAGIGGVTRSGGLSTTLANVTLGGVGAIPSTPSTGGGKTFASNKKKRKQLKVIETEEWLKAEETAKQLLQDRFTKTTPEAKLEALSTHIESLQPVIEALRALANAVQETDPVRETQTEEITEHKQLINRFDALEKKIEDVEELLILLLADI